MSKHAQPYQVSPNEPTKKQVWLASFTALLTHMSPEEAVTAADRALELCDERWASPGWAWTWQFQQNFPVGHRFTPAGYDASEGLGARSTPDDATEGNAASVP